MVFLKEPNILFEIKYSHAYSYILNSDWSGRPSMIIGVRTERARHAAAHFGILGSKILWNQFYFYSYTCILSAVI